MIDGFTDAQCEARIEALEPPARQHIRLLRSDYYAISATRTMASNAALSSDGFTFAELGACAQDLHRCLYAGR